MKQKFSCIPVEYEGEFLWCIFEHATDQVINSFIFEEDALKYIQFLEGGGAFDGYTPAFVTEPVQLSATDLDDCFNSLVT